MQDGPRLLVAAALGKIIEPLLRQSLPAASVRIASGNLSSATARPIAWVASSSVAPGAKL